MTWRSSRSTAAALVTLATFADVVAYSVCVPVLPDFAHRLGASPTMIGLLFASFGVTLLMVAIPMGALSDRVGRRLPLVGGMVALAGATLIFAEAASLPALFAARMVQGAADGVTWVVGLAVIADAYGSEERGRVMGYVMSGTSLGIMVGPSIGGWLYEAGGVRLPFEAVAALALACAAGFALFEWPQRKEHREHPAIWTMVRRPAIAACAAAVILTGGTIALIEPLLSLFFSRSLGMTPSRIGALFGTAAIASTIMPFVYGPLVNRWGGRRLTILGLLVTASWMPLLATASGFRSALALIVVQWIAIALIVTPSLAYMAEVTASAGEDAYGIGYGIYNTAWGVGLLIGPALGGVLFEHFGFAAVTAGWALLLWVVTIALTGVKSRVPLGGS